MGYLFEFLTRLSSQAELRLAQGKAVSPPIIHPEGRRNSPAFVGPGRHVRELARRRIRSTS